MVQGWPSAFRSGEPSRRCRVKHSSTGFPACTCHQPAATAVTRQVQHTMRHASAGRRAFCLARAAGDGEGGGGGAFMSILPAKPAPPPAQASCTVTSSSTGAPVSGASWSLPPCFGEGVLARQRLVVPKQVPPDTWCGGAWWQWRGGRGGEARHLREPFDAGVARVERRRRGPACPPVRRARHRPRLGQGIHADALRVALAILPFHLGMPRAFTVTFVMAHSREKCRGTLDTRCAATDRAHAGIGISPKRNQPQVQRRASGCGELGEGG